MKVRSNTNFNQNQLLFPVAHKLSADPGGPVEGQFYYHTGKQIIYVYSGSTWVPCGFSTHIHPISDITLLQASLDAKTPYGHSHYVSDIVDVWTQLAAKTHTHPISEVINLQSSLDGKASVSHSHSISAITGLQTALDSKSVIGHTHAIGDVSGLQGSLDSKAAYSHGHVISDISGLQTALDAKAAASHSHAISEVLLLQSSLNAKIDKAGGAFTGAVVACDHGSASNMEIVNVCYSTGSLTPVSAPEGSLFIQYT